MRTLRIRRFLVWIFLLGVLMLAVVRLSAMELAEMKTELDRRVQTSSEE